MCCTVASWRSNSATWSASFARRSRCERAELEREKLALRALSVDIVEALINALEAKDVYLRGHSQRVAHLAAAVAQEMGLDEDTVEEIRLAGDCTTSARSGSARPS